MGKMVITRRYVGWVEERKLALAPEDFALREKRRAAKHGDDYAPRIFGWQKRFVEHLESCPYCGKKPICGCIWDERRGYDYKLVCCEKGMLNCGDWYPQLSRAGLDWNFRVRIARGEQYRHCPHWKPKKRED